MVEQEPMLFAEKPVDQIVSGAQPPRSVVGEEGVRPTPASREPHTGSSVTIKHGDTVVDLPVRGRVLKQDPANKVTSYSPDGRTCYQVEYVKDEGFVGEDGFRIERPQAMDEEL